MFALFVAFSVGENNLTDPPVFPTNIPIPSPPASTLDDTEEYVKALSQRSCQDICYGYNTSWIPSATTKWTGSASGCDLGTYSDAAMKDALNRLNYVRWLAGITSHNVTTTAAKNTGCQKCAVILDSNNIVTTSPGSSNKCWTSEGQAHCQVSLVTLSEDAASAISAYYLDNGMASLGNRRWILYPPLNTIGIGQRRKGSALQVINTDYKNKVTLPFMAVPGPGGYPMSLLPKDWSFSSNINLNGATVSIVRSDGRAVSCSVDDKYAKKGVWGLPTIRIHSMPSSLIATGFTYTITVKLGSETWTYTTTLYDCSKTCSASSPTPVPSTATTRPSTATASTKPSTATATTRPSTATSAPSSATTAPRPSSSTATPAPTTSCGPQCDAKVKEFVTTLKKEFVAILDKLL